jgi:hypothetical protein
LRGWELLEPRLLLSGLVANYRSDFHVDLPLTAGWRYLWNAPVGWDPATNSTGDMATGSIVDPSCFRPMLDAGSYWTADGDTDGTNHGPDHYVRLTSTGGHPGAPAGIVAGGGTNGLPRYAIAAYTLAADGCYAIADSWLNKPSTSGDAVEVRVSVNGGSPYCDLFASPGATVQYDTYLGPLHAGDTVYVAFGPSGSHTSDAFSTDFSVIQTSPRPEPLRSLAVAQHFHVADYGATPDDSTNDAPAIQAALNAANIWQQQNHRPVEVDFAAGVYRLYNGYVPGSPPTVLTLLNARDMVIEGNGAELLVTDPTVGAFVLHTCSNMIVRDFTIDYETLPFTQGRITQILDSYSFVLDVEAGFPAPTDAQFTGTTQRWGYPIDPLVDGRIRADANNYFGTTAAVRLSGSLYQMTVSTNTSTLRVGDRYVEQARTGNAVISLPNCTQPSVIGVTAYTGPSVFVAALLSLAPNVIDCHAAIKPGRWKSLDADGVHVQSARVGAWIENSSFEGLSDDAINFYTLPFAVTQVLGDTQFKFGLLLNRGTTVGSFNFRHFRPGDELTFLNPTLGTPLASVRVIDVDLTAQTVTVDQPVTGITTGTTSQVTNVYNTTLAGAFLVQESSFLNGRRYGMFLKAGNGQVINNHFEGLSHEAISIYNEPNWPEGLWSGNLLIQGNTFVDNGFEYQYKHQTSRIPGTIGIHAERLGYLPVSGIYVDPNIQLIDNTFQGWRRAAIAAGNVENLEIRGNRFLAPVSDPAIAQDTVVVLTSADGAMVADNSYPVLTAPDAFLTQDAYCLDVTQSGNWIDHPPTAIRVTPQTVAENRPLGTRVGDLVSTDVDPSDTFTYTLVDTDVYPDNAAFVIEDDQLKSAVVFDYETRSSYSIRLRTTDSGAMSFDQTLVIAVDDVNDPPVIGSLSASPNPVTAGEPLTLIATGVADPADPGGAVLSVSFYRESNGIAGLQTDAQGDTLVATDNDPADGWSASVATDGLTAGTYTYYAQATDNESALSVGGLDAVATASLLQAACSVDVDYNGTADALTDGILILRYLFAPAGQWNYTDAVGIGAARTSRELLRSYLDGEKNSVLDVDGNGTADALTDGILILRYLFAPAGEWNYHDAVGVGATRTTREAIRAHLDEFNLNLSPSRSTVPDTVPLSEQENGLTSGAPAGQVALDTTAADNHTVQSVGPAILVVEGKEDRSDSIPTDVPHVEADSGARAWAVALQRWEPEPMTTIPDVQPVLPVHAQVTDEVLADPLTYESLRLFSHAWRPRYPHAAKAGKLTPPTTLAKLLVDTGVPRKPFTVV